MSKMSREKGKRGEREVVVAFHAAGLPAKRMSPLQASKSNNDADVIACEGLGVEVKRQERLRVQEWCRQAESNIDPLLTPVVAYRTSGEPWRVVLRLEDFIDILKERAA